jgi:hypothetical protein
LPNKKKKILHYKAKIHPATMTTPSTHHPGAFPTATFDTCCENVPAGAVVVDVEDRVVTVDEPVSEFVVVLFVDPPDDAPVAPEAEVEEEADVVVEAEVVVDGDVVGVVATEATVGLANISVTVEDPVPLGSGSGVFVHALMRSSSMLNLSHSGVEEQLQNSISAHGSQEKSFPTAGSCTYRSTISRQYFEHGTSTWSFPIKGHCAHGPLSCAYTATHKSARAQRNAFKMLFFIIAADIVY